MSIVFHAQGWLTIAQLTRAWGRELAKGGDRNEVAHHLMHILGRSGRMVGGWACGL
jgi:hypothetical protein